MARFSISRARASDRRWLPLVAATALSLAGCGHGGLAARGDVPEAEPPQQATPQVDEVYMRAQLERARHLEDEVERLRADLRQAEEAMVKMESGLRDLHTRADAVSALAEARISVERASKNVTWREDEVQEAREKLDEAERQFQKGHAGSAVFFASRAQRMAETLNDEARRVTRARDARFVKAQRVNLRAGPTTDDRVIEVLSGSTPVFPEQSLGDWILVRTASGRVGWVHSALLRER